MSVPMFIHVMSDASIWVTNDINYTPTGTITGTYRVNSDCQPTKIDTLTGSGNASASAIATPKKTGKYGKEIV